MRWYLADQLCDSCILISAWWLPLCFVRTFDNLVADIQHFLFIASLVPKVQYPWRHIVGEALQPIYIIHTVETVYLNIHLTLYSFSLHWLRVCHPSSISEPMFENLTVWPKVASPPLFVVCPEVGHCEQRQPDQVHSTQCRFVHLTKRTCTIPIPLYSEVDQYYDTGNTVTV